MPDLRCNKAAYTTIIVSASLICLASCRPVATASRDSDAGSKTPSNQKSPLKSEGANTLVSAVQPESVRGPLFNFKDATQAWNLDFERYDDITGLNRIQEGLGGGVATFDYDLDGRLDVFFCQGSRLPRSKVTHEYSNELYRNVGQLEKATAAAGLTSFGYHTGSTVGDIDDDGFPDLFLAAYGKAALWHNNGDGTFSDITESSRVLVDSWSSSAALADFNGDGLLDLYVVTYLVADDDPPRLCKEPRAPTGTVQCSPTIFPALDDFLFLNTGAGQFLDVTQVSGITGKDGKGLAIAACDFDGDGSLEIVVANDGTPTFFYVRSKLTQSADYPDLLIPHFEERAAEMGVALTGEGRTISGMSAAHGDYDRDGWVDLYITNFYLEPNVLFRNLKGKGFIDSSTVARVGPPTRSTLSFGAEFIDVDHDGWMDLIATTGHIEDRSWIGVEPYKMKPHLFRNDRNGRFTDVASAAGSYFTSSWVGRGLAIGDLDRDGDLDVVISHTGDRSAIILNQTPKSQSSVVIKPIGRMNSPRSAVGTRILATGVQPILYREIAGGGSYQSASALEIHLGLGESAKFEQLECTWPDGQIERWSDVAPGYYVAVQQRGLLKIDW